MPRLVLNAATVTLTLAVAASLSARALSLPVSNSIESRHADKGRYHPLPRDAEGGSLQVSENACVLWRATKVLTFPVDRLTSSWLAWTLRHAP